MGTTQLLQLQPVLDGPQEAVRRGQLRCVVAADVAAVGERGQRDHRGGAAQRLVAAAVDELQQLHRELHVAQPAAARA